MRKSYLGLKFMYSQKLRAQKKCNPGEKELIIPGKLESQRAEEVRARSRARESIGYKI